MMPLVPSRLRGAVTHVEVGLPFEQVEEAGRPAVILEPLMKPLLGTAAGPPTPKNSRSVVPSKNSVNEEHSAPVVLFTTQLVVGGLLLLSWPAVKGYLYIWGRDGAPSPDTNPQAIIWPVVVPFIQNSLSKSPE